MIQMVARYAARLLIFSHRRIKGISTTGGGAPLIKYCYDSLMITNKIIGNTTPRTKHREVQVSREGRMPVVTGGGTSPWRGEVERSTTAWTQEVEQRMEHLPRMPEPRVMHGAITE